MVWSAIIEWNALWEYYLWVDCVCRCMSRFRLKSTPSSFLTVLDSILTINHRYMKLELLNGWETYGGREQRESGFLGGISLNSVILSSASLMHTFINIFSYCFHSCKHFNRTNIFISFVMRQFLRWVECHYEWLYSLTYL